MYANTVSFHGDYVFINSEKPLWFSPLDFIMVQLYVDLETKFTLLD